MFWDPGGGLILGRWWDGREWKGMRWDESVLDTLGISGVRDSRERGGLKSGTLTKKKKKIGLWSHVFILLMYWNYIHTYLNDTTALTKEKKEISSFISTIYISRKLASLLSTHFFKLHNELCISRGFTYYRISIVDLMCIILTTTMYLSSTNCTQDQITRMIALLFCPSIT